MTRTGTCAPWSKMKTGLK
ncbi:unnamed protein product [Oppiella nova]|uniref:Uncharacterized protein n=1 Tax=Oppiella nova TaxID=334625 RepID=A0A7R9MV13_9ACAR|nr:unnamed protein product [Oppiella nova]CAG2182841.1 unnamed protein product [Oppiella nova]